MRRDTERVMTLGDGQRIIASHLQIHRSPNVKYCKRRFLAMTRKGFHVLLALTLVVCVLSPYVEFAFDLNETIFSTAYDTETTIAVIALLLILAFALAKFLVSVLLDSTAEEPLPESHVTFSGTLDFISTLPNVSPPPLPLRI